MALAKDLYGSSSGCEDGPAPGVEVPDLDMTMAVQKS
jgi:hypothetical protein